MLSAIYFLFVMYNDEYFVVKKLRNVGMYKPQVGILLDSSLHESTDLEIQPLATFLQCVETFIFRNNCLSNAPNLKK